MTCLLLVRAIPSLSTTGLPAFLIQGWKDTSGFISGDGDVIQKRVFLLLLCIQETLTHVQTIQLLLIRSKGEKLICRTFSQILARLY